MPKLLHAAALSCALALSACVTPTGSGSTSIITQTQAYAQAACGFLPAVETVTGIFAAGDPTLATASAVAEAICGAIGKTKVTRHSKPPSVAGVAIKGSYVR